MTATEAAPKSKLTLWVLVWALVIFLVSRPFGMQLEGIDPTGPSTQVSKPFGDYLHYALTLGVVGLVIQRGAMDQVLRTILAAPFLLAFVGLGIVSAVWSEEPYLTVRTSVAFAGSVFCVAAAITLLSKSDAVRAMLVAMALCIVFSVIWALLIPHYGQHDTNDIYQASHVGKWRGVYRHKNILGQVAGIAVGAMLSAGGRLVPRYVRFGVIALGLICLGFAQSASGLLIAAAGLGFGIALFRFTGYFRWLAVAVGVLGCILLSGSGSELLSSILVAMGKSPTFSGRTLLWNAAAGLIADKWLLGYGLSTINDPSITAVFFAVNGEVYDAHNSYLELALALGLVGLFLHLATVLDAAFRALRARLSVSGEAARQCLLLVIIMWCISALAEAAPFLPSEPVEAFGLFAVVWLSASPLSRGRGGSSDGETSTSSKAKLSVTQSGRRKSAKSHLELD